MAGGRLVVVGGSLAGLRAVESARKAGHSGPISFVCGERHLPYDRPPLSKAYLDAVEEGADPPTPQFRTEEHLTDELEVDLRRDTWATGLDVDGRVLHTDGDELPFTALIIATGATARTFPEAAELAGVFTLRTLDDAIGIRAALDAGARTVVIGAGFIGSEIASAARKRELPVTVVEALVVPLGRSVGEDVGHACAELHRAHGTDLRCGTTVTSIEGSHDGHVERVVLDDGSALDADLVVVGTGVTPATGWLEDSGLTLHDGDRGVVCDETLRAAAGIYAAGDVAHWPNPLFDGLLMRLEHWTNAAEQGALAARNALGPENAKPAAAVPYFWSDWYGSRIQFVGVPGADEIRVVSEERLLGLYRTGDRLTGAITIDRPAQIMKYRRMIRNRASWEEALEFAGVG